MKKRKKPEKKNPRDLVRHPTPKTGFAFKDRKRKLTDDEHLKEMKDYN